MQLTGTFTITVLYLKLKNIRTLNFKQPAIQIIYIGRVQMYC